MAIIEISGPDWLDDTSMASCEQCGHSSSFAAGFETDEAGGYGRGWYSDEISCYNWTWYDPEDDKPEEFKKFLKETGTDEAKQLLEEMNKRGL